MQGCLPLPGSKIVQWKLHFPVDEQETVDGDGGGGVYFYPILHRDL